MPLSCAKALAPTMALLFCTGKAVTAETSFDARVSMFGLDAGSEGQHILAGAQRHDDFFQRRIAGALADAVDRAFDLPRAAATPAMELATAIPRSLWQWAEKIALSMLGTRSRTISNRRAIFLRRCIADGVGDIDGASRRR